MHRVTPKRAALVLVGLLILMVTMADSCSDGSTAADQRAQAIEKRVENFPLRQALAEMTTRHENAVFAGLLVVVVGLVALVLMGGLFGLKAYGRYQSRADRSQNRQQALYDARNQTTINQIKISQTGQLVKVAKQSAQIRYETAVGVRKAQDEISSTLTPLYVQFEMIDALKAIAQSGRNNTVVYIPTGDSGVPLVSTVPQTVK